MPRDRWRFAALLVSIYRFPLLRSGCDNGRARLWASRIHRLFPRCVRDIYLPSYVRLERM